MNEPLLIQRQRRLLNDLYCFSAERAQAEVAAETALQTRTVAADKRFQETKKNVESRFAADLSAADKEWEDAKLKITIRFESGDYETRKVYKETKQRIENDFQAKQAQTQKEYEEAQWTVEAVLEAAKNDAVQRLQETERKIAEGLEKKSDLEEQAEALLAGWRQKPPPASEKDASASTSAGPAENPYRQLNQALKDATTHLNKLKKMKLPSYFVGLRPFLFAAILVIPATLIGWLIGSSPMAAGIAGGAALVTSGTLLFILHIVAKSQVRKGYAPFESALNEVEADSLRCETLARVNYQKLITKGTEKHDRDLEIVVKKYPLMLTELKRRHQDALQKADETYPRKLAELKALYADDMQISETRYRQQTQAIHEQRDREIRENQEGFTNETAAGHRDSESAWQTLSQNWRQGIASIQHEASAIQSESNQLFPGWEGLASSAWKPTDQVAPVLRFGEFAVRMSDIPQAIPAHERLSKDVPADFTLPGLVPFSHGCSMLFEAQDDGRAQAVSTMQMAMLRLLVSNPPGKVRFTIIDPVGLGENFSAFMHLADFDEALVGSRIWTESEHIDARLSDMTAHMENVIQKYLRNQYQSIEEYNAEAGEVAEPFRILVIANFPTNFSVDAARRLLSIAGSGARCGVYTLIAVDTKQMLPVGFDLKDLEQACATLRWSKDHFVWNDPDFARYRLQLDLPPSDAVTTQILHQVGQKAKNANRVEVPFEFVAPPTEEWWTRDSRSGISVALGRAGATKRQYLELGKGTSQHVLVAGKTGSGKSTLLHAMIVNLALAYSPDEIELYLIDFKKGVEFKAYANQALPHARVIAIESEREFGLSVLQRLDVELKMRGDQFRAVGVHEIAAYRNANGDTPLPRIMLVVDEFQEFFVEDDRIARDAALLLDRLVRQGRAFGIHIFLGSQTLGGAFNPARSTIDQMAVRIALQCSETDAHLILSADNPAARLLSRPGEAIYNDANGLIEGNDLFQVVWLPDERKEKYLQRIREMAQAKQGRIGVAYSQLVFEGNAPADVKKNLALQKCLTDWRSDSQGANAPRTGAAAVKAWLGEAVAIKDPTAAIFRRQTSSNLLIVGQQSESALGIMSTALLSVLTQSPGAKIYVLDGTPADDPHAGALVRLSVLSPTAIQVGGPRETPDILSAIAQEIETRQANSATDASSIYLFIHGLQRFRDLRKQDDDYGFSRRDDEKPNPAKLLATILREGSTLGIHTLLWCDTLTNVNRCLDRQGLREFEQRVLFQMSADDSSNLIDSPLAAKLGVNRALYFSEEQGIAEKFRPYGMPTREWAQGLIS